MTEIKIDLSAFSDRFASDSRDLKIAKGTTFIFGRNGTGKTTITKAIKEQFDDEYNVCVFRDFDGIVGENKRLDAIALGTENAEVQKQVDAVDKEIAEIEKETEEPEDKTENLFTKLITANKNFDVQSKKIKKFYTDTAQKIKNLNNPQIAKTTYYKNDFQDEISKAKLLSDDEIKKHKATIKAEPKAIVAKDNFPELGLAEWLKSTNEVLTEKVAQHQIIEELQNNANKQNFAKIGVDLHTHVDGTHDEKCAFCGGSISDDRWVLLGSYFNDEVKKLESRVENGIAKVNAELVEIDGIKEIGKSDFYNKFAEQIKTLNLQIKNAKNDYKTFFDSLKLALEDKRKNLFSSSDELELTTLQGFNAIKTEYEKMVDENNYFSKNLNTEQDKAKNALRFHEVKKALDNYKYEAENQKLADLKNAQEQAQKALDDKKQELENKKTVKNELILKTRDENKIADDINKLLKNIGVASFSLKLVKNDDENQKGQYKILGYNDVKRTVNDLSKGEKNIIAFLYFIFALSEPSGNNKPKIIVFDDPMTSNDDTMQYLMTEQIRKLYEKVNNSNDRILLLTHNLHFYLNVRPNYNEAEEKKILQRNKKQTDTSKKEKTFYEKNGYYELRSNGTHTTIKPVNSRSQDSKNSYAALWEDLAFLHDNDKPVSMLNNCRRIIETYMKFNQVEREFYKNSEFVRKLFNVNSHSIDDQENELNGKTREEIKTMLYELFKSNSAEKHFNNYWGDEVKNKSI